MRRMHHMTICAEGFYYLAIMGFILSAALIRQINLLMVLYGVLAGPLLLSWSVVRRQVKRIDVARSAPPTVVAGDPFVIELELRNNRRRGGSFGLTLVDELERVGRREKPLKGEVYCTHLPAGESRKLVYQGRVPQRGVYEFQPLRLSSRFPLGLLRTLVRIDKPQRLVVLPKMGRLAPSWHRLLRSEEGSSVGGRRQAGMQEGDFYGMREWRPGDARSRIHWRTSARRRALTVRQYERRRNVPLALFVELWEPKSPTPADRARTEAVISFAATVIAEAYRDGGRAVQLHLIAKRSRALRGTANTTVLHEAQRALAAAEPTAVDELPAVLNKAAGEDRSQATNVVVLSTRSVDLNDRDRFAALTARPDARAWAARCLTFWPGGDRWATMFREPDA